MKVTKLHYDRLETAIRTFKALYKPTDSDKLDPWQERIRHYQADPRFKDWRIAFIWAVYHDSIRLNATIRDMMVNGGYNDSHIETALKKILHDEVYP